MRFLVLAVVLGGAVMSSGCAPYNRLMRSLAAEERVVQEVTGFYDNAADAYFMIGLEYFHLADEMQKAGKEEEYQTYARKAKIYADFSKEWKRQASERRAMQVHQATADDIGQ